MARKLLIAFAVVALIAIMVGAPMHEAFEQHDTTPFPIDSEYTMMTLGSLLTTCLSVALSTLPSLCLMLAFVCCLTLALRVQTPLFGYEVEHGRLLYSPPRSLFSLRI